MYSIIILESNDWLSWGWFQTVYSSEKKSFLALISECRLEGKHTHTHQRTWNYLFVLCLIWFCFQSLETLWSRKVTVNNLKFGKKKWLQKKYKATKPEKSICLKHYWFLISKCTLYNGILYRVVSTGLNIWTHQFTASGSNIS